MAVSHALLACSLLAASAVGADLRLTGRVIDGVNGAPLGGAAVSLAGASGLPRTLTAADGSFLLTGDPVGIRARPRAATPAAAPGIGPADRAVYASEGSRLAGPIAAGSYFAARPLPRPASPLAKSAAAETLALRVENAGYHAREVPASAPDAAVGDVSLDPASHAWRSAKVLLWAKYDGKPADLVAAAEKAGLNLIQVMDRYFTQGKPANADLVRLANAKGIKVFVIVQTFFNESVPATSATSARGVDGQVLKDGWLTFICPNEEAYKDRRLEDIRKLVATVRPDGISLDFFRFFVYWEGPNRIQSCFDSRCLKKFAAQYGVTAAPSAILKDHLADWTAFKCRTIADYAARIHAEAKRLKPDLLLNLHLVPWKQDEYGGALRSVAAQDLRLLGRYFDLVQPMTYGTLLKKDVAWVRAVAVDAQAQVAGEAHVIPCLQPLQATSANRALVSAAPVTGYSLWPFEEF